jgi:hypothetical protein
MKRPWLILVLLLTVGFTLGTFLVPTIHQRPGREAESGNVLALLMGDSRRMFANHFFIKAESVTPHPDRVQQRIDELRQKPKRNHSQP